MSIKNKLLNNNNIINNKLTANKLIYYLDNNLNNYLETYYQYLTEDLFFYKKDKYIGNNSFILYNNSKSVNKFYNDIINIITNKYNINNIDIKNNIRIIDDITFNKFNNQIIKILNKQNNIILSFNNITDFIKYILKNKKIIWYDDTYYVYHISFILKNKRQIEHIINLSDLYYSYYYLINNIDNKENIKINIIKFNKSNDKENNLIKSSFIVINDNEKIYYFQYLG